MAVPKSLWFPSQTLLNPETRLPSKAVEGIWSGLEHPMTSTLKREWGIDSVMGIHVNFLNLYNFIFPYPKDGRQKSAQAKV